MVNVANIKPYGCFIKTKKEVDSISVPELKQTNWYLSLIYWILIFISFQLSYFLSCSRAKADDCERDLNIKQIEKTSKEIRTIWLHTESNYIRLDRDEKKKLKKMIPERPDLKIFLH